MESSDYGLYWPILRWGPFDSGTAVPNSGTTCCASATKFNAQSTTSDSSSISYPPSSTTLLNSSASTFCQSSSDHKPHALTTIGSRTTHTSGHASSAIWSCDILEPRSASSRGQEHCGVQPSSDGKQASREANPIHLTACSVTTSTCSTNTNSFCYSSFANHGSTTTTAISKLFTQISIPSSSVSVQTT